MKKGAYSFLIVLSIGIASWYVLFSLQPYNISNLNEKPQNFSTLRAFEHVKAISQKPHYIGSDNHSNIRNYIIDELEKLGLTVQTQKAFSLSQSGSLTVPENIIARIKGSDNKGDALMLLSHYDSAVHSSYGASDAASGVAAIIETLRAFKTKGNLPKNDIIICFTDGEEVGLNGARLFAKQHPWAKDVKLVLNFEARGSGGPSNMIVETNYGNQNLINSFADAKPGFPVASSLMYNVYKLLPNNTDSTVFREELDVPSLFFAFIDDHFDYHTANDIPERLDKRSLAHQGSYLESALQHYSNIDLNNLKSENNSVYFNLPFIGLVHYPYSLSPYLLVLSLLLLFTGIFYGIKKKKLSRKEIFKGFIPFLLLLISSAGLGYVGWEIILYLYPHYNEYLNGFTPNGYEYIIAFALLVVCVYMLLYNYYFRKINTANALVAPIIFWMLINLIVIIYLPGGAFLIVPLLLTLFTWFVFIFYRRPSFFILFLIQLPTLWIFVPYIKSFPVGLGLSSVYITCLLTAFTLGLMSALIYPLYKKKAIALSAFLFALGFFIVAHLNSNFNKENPKPNSLIYMANHNNEKAYWKSYDKILDEWTKPYFEQSESNSPQDTIANATFDSKYGNLFKQSKETDFYDINLTETSTEKRANRYLISLNPLKAHRISLFKGNQFQVDSFSINGKDYTKLMQKKLKKRSSRLLSYYVVDQLPIKIEILTQQNLQPELFLISSSYSLFENEDLNVKRRPPKYMPKPFVLNDACVSVREISF